MNKEEQMRLLRAKQKSASSPKSGGYGWCKAGTAPALHHAPSLASLGTHARALLQTPTWWQPVLLQALGWQALRRQTTPHRPTRTRLHPQPST
jgi:hypothetical protein